MGMTAENLAVKYEITREEQDTLATLSHHRATDAINNGRFKDEIVPVEIKTRKGTTIVDVDEHPRADISMASLAKLRPAFKKEGGTVTAGNASGLNDGGAALVIMSATKAKELGLKPIAKLLATASYGVKPEIMGIGPAFAIPKALKYADLKLSDIDYFEINEAFAVQVLSFLDHFGISDDDPRVNRYGGAIAVGHPLASSGVRLMNQLARQFEEDPSVRYGITTMCIGLGMGATVIWENPHHSDYSGAGAAVAANEATTEGAAA